MHSEKLVSSRGATDIKRLSAVCFCFITQVDRASGVGRHGHGSITAIYTVLPAMIVRIQLSISRASLDGQVMLSRELA